MKHYCWLKLIELPILSVAKSHTLLEEAKLVVVAVRCLFVFRIENRSELTFFRFLDLLLKLGIIHKELHKLRCINTFCTHWCCWNKQSYRYSTASAWRAYWPCKMLPNEKYYDVSICTHMLLLLIATQTVGSFLNSRIFIPLLRCFGLNRQRMNGCFQFISQRMVYQSVSLNKALSFEFIRYNDHFKVWLRSCRNIVLVTFIYNFHENWWKSCSQFFSNKSFYGVRGFGHSACCWCKQAQGRFHEQFSSLLTEIPQFWWGWSNFVW